MWKTYFPYIEKNETRGFGGSVRSVIAWKIKYCIIFSLLLIYYLPSQRTHYCPLLCELPLNICIYSCMDSFAVRALFDFSLKLLTQIEIIINSIFLSRQIEGVGARCELQALIWWLNMFSLDIIVSEWKNILFCWCQHNFHSCMIFI